MIKTMQLPCFESKKLLVYGDVMLDRYWHGSAARISPEAPVPVVLVNHTETCPGGAANVALNLLALGVDTTLFGLTGQDREGQILEEMLKKRQVDCHFQSIADHSTITKWRVLSNHQQLVRMDFETHFTGIDDSALIRDYQEQLKTVDAVLLSDYAKGALHQVETLIALARKKDCPCDILRTIIPSLHQYIRHHHIN